MGSSGSSRNTAISLIVVSLFILTASVGFASVPGIVAQDDPGTKNSPISFKTNEEGEMSQGHRINVNVTTGNLVVKHTDLVIPAVGQDIVIERTYNSLDKVDGIEKGFEVIIYGSKSFQMHVSPGVAWINGERVEMSTEHIWQVIVPGGGGTFRTYYAYVRNMGSGVATIEYVTSPRPRDAAVDRYYLGEIFVMNGDEGDDDSIDYTEYATSFYTGLIHSVRIESEEHDNGKKDYTLLGGLVGINGEKYLVNGVTDIHVVPDGGPTPYFYLEPSTSTHAACTVSFTLPNANTHPDGYIILGGGNSNSLRITPPRPFVESFPQKEPKMGTKGKWRFNFDSHAVLYGGQPSSSDMKFDNGDGSTIFIEDASGSSTITGHTDKREYFSGSYSYVSNGNGFDSDIYSLDGNRIWAYCYNFTLTDLSDKSWTFKGIELKIDPPGEENPVFYRGNAVLSEIVDANGNRLVYEWKDADSPGAPYVSNGKFEGTDGTDIPRDYYIARIYDDSDANGSPDSVEVSFAYNASGYITTVYTTPNGGPIEAVAEYRYGASGDLIGFTDFHSRNFTYEYDSDGERYLTAIWSDSTGDASRVNYDCQSRKVSRIRSPEYSDTISGDFYPECSGGGEQAAPEGMGGTSGGFGNADYTYFFDVNDPWTEEISYQESGLTDVTVNIYQWKFDKKSNANTIEDRRIIRKAVFNQVDYSGDPNGTGYLTESTWAYNASTMKVTNFTDGNNHTTSYNYNSKRQITLKTYPDNKTESFVYGAYNNLTSKTDRNNKTVGFVYGDPVNPHLVTSINYDVDGVSKSKTFSYHSDGLLDTATDSEGYSISYSHDSHGQLDTKSFDRTIWIAGSPQIQSASELFDYNIFGQLLSTTDAVGHQVTSTYDNEHYLLNKSEMVDVDGQQVSKTESYDYDTLGNLISVTDYEGGITLYSYNADSQVATVWKKDSAGQDQVVGEFDYDTTGKLIWKKDAIGHETEIHRNAAGWVTSAVEKSVTTETGVQDLVTSYTHDGVGKVLTKTTPGASDSWDYTYDSVNRLETVMEPGSISAASYSYDGNGNLLSFTDPKTNPAFFTYNEINRVTTASQSGRETVNFIYDGEGRVSESWEGTVPVHNIFSYNAEGTLGSINMTDTQTLIYGYDVRGLEVYSSRADSIGASVELLSSRNINGLLTTRIQRVDSNDRSTHYMYNALGQVSYIDYPSAVTGDPFGVDYQYSADAFHYLKAVPGFVDNIEYDAAGRIVRMDHTNGLYEITTRDELGRPLFAGVAEALVGTKTKFVEYYNWEVAGNLADKTREEYNTKKMTLLSTVTEIYGYDANDRLVSAIDDLAAFVNGYQYDEAGNRLTDPMDPNQTSDYYGYDSINRMVRLGFTGQNHLEIGWMEPDGRSRGNMTSKTLVDGTGTPISTDSVYTWSEDNLLLSVDRTGIVSVDYRYAPNGDRVFKEVTSGVSSGQTARYVFAGLNVLYEEKDVAGDITVDYYVHAFGRQIARVEGIPGRRGYDYEWYNYHSDYLNSVWVISDDRGKVVWTKGYRPFGSESTQTGDLTNDYQFAGKGFEL